MTITTEQPGPAAGQLRSLVAEEVRVWLARRRMSGAELARRIGRSQTFIAKRLDGRQAFDVDDLEQVARILDVPAAAFLTPAGRGVTDSYTPRFSPASSSRRASLTLVRTAAPTNPGVTRGNGSSRPSRRDANGPFVPRTSGSVNHADAA